MSSDDLIGLFNLMFIIGYQNCCKKSNFKVVLKAICMLWVSLVFHTIVIFYGTIAYINVDWLEWICLLKVGIQPVVGLKTGILIWDCMLCNDGIAVTIYGWFGGHAETCLCVACFVVVTCMGLGLYESCPQRPTIEM